MGMFSVHKTSKKTETKKKKPTVHDWIGPAGLTPAQVYSAMDGEELAREVRAASKPTTTKEVK